MKVKVMVQHSATVATNTMIEVTVAAGDTVENVWERVALEANTLCFPDQKLLFNGKALPNSSRLSACDVKDGDALELHFEASESTLVEQLVKLLDQKELKLEELGLLYTFRHCVPFEDALKALGYAKGTLQDFLNDQKHFCVRGGLVKVADRQSTRSVLEPVPLTSSPSTEANVGGLIEVVLSVEIQVPDSAPVPLSLDDDEDDENGLRLPRLEASQTVAKVRQALVAFQQIPFADGDLLLGGEKLDSVLSLKEAGVTDGAHLTMVVRASEASLASQLEELLLEWGGPSSITSLSQKYSLRFGAHVRQALQILKLSGDLRCFLEGRPQQFCVAAGLVALANLPQVITPLCQCGLQDEWAMKVPGVQLSPWEAPWRTHGPLVTT